MLTALTLPIRQIRLVGHNAEKWADLQRRAGGRASTLNIRATPQGRKLLLEASGEGGTLKMEVPGSAWYRHHAASDAQKEGINDPARRKKRAD